MVAGELRKYLLAQVSKLYIEKTKHATYYYNELGEVHREDGPAMIFYNGIKKYYLNNNEYTKEQHFEEVLKRNIREFKNV